MKILHRATLAKGNKLHQFTGEGQLIAEAVDAELDALERRITTELRMLASRIDGMKGRGWTDEA